MRKFSTPLTRQLPLPRRQTFFPSRRRRRAVSPSPTARPRVGGRWLGTEGVRERDEVIRKKEEEIETREKEDECLQAELRKVQRAKEFKPTMFLVQSFPLVESLLEEHQDGDDKGKKKGKKKGNGKVATERKKPCAAYTLWLLDQWNEMRLTAPNLPDSSLFWLARQVFDELSCPWRFQIKKENTEADFKDGEEGCPRRVLHPCAS